MAKTCKVCGDDTINKWGKIDVALRNNTDNDSFDDDQDGFIRMLICPKCGAAKVKIKNVQD
jgi:hypothetical protein